MIGLIFMILWTLLLVVSDILILLSDFHWILKVLFSAAIVFLLYWSMFGIYIFSMLVYYFG